MALNDNTKFAITLVTLVSLVLSVIIGTISVYNHNEENYRSSRELIRDNSELLKDMMSQVTAYQLNMDDRVATIESTRWSITQESENAARNAIANPGIRYADPKNPGHFFYVEPLNANAR